MSNVNFEDAIAGHKAARAANDPLSVQRAELVPVRARAIEYIDQFRSVVDSKRPEITAALQRYNSAVEIGIQHTPLRAAIVTAMTLLDNGANGFRSVVEEIDNLDKHTVQQGWHRMIPSRLESFTPNIGEVTTLSNRVATLMVELEELVRTTVPVRPARLMDTGGTAGPTQTLVTEFDPRIKL